MSEVVAIAGPTAVGKSALGLELALRFGGEIVSADALQIYRGFDVGTAKPSSEERARVRHHLIDILEPHERFSAGEFVRQARRSITSIHQRHRLALVVGGSGLYLRALRQGIALIPPIRREVHHEVRRRLRRDGQERLRRQLEELDPETAARLEPRDTQRTVRAVEVALSTGTPLSDWLEADPRGHSGLEAVLIGLTLPRAVLYDRIAQRVRRMIRSGWVEEVRGLLVRGLNPELPAFQAIGYRQLAAYVGGEATLEEAVTSTIRASCRYAKRQLTWFRREPDIIWFSSEDPRHCTLEVVTFLKRRGLGGNNGQG